MTIARSDDRQRNEASALIGAIGRLPRVLSSSLVVVLWIVAGSVLVLRGFLVSDLILIVPPVGVLLLSLRIKARVTSEQLIVRSYFRTYRFAFDEVLAFVDVPYQGWWSGYTPAYLFGTGPSQLDVEMIRSRQSRSLPATMCSRKVAAQIADILNERVPGGDFAGAM